MDKTDIAVIKEKLNNIDERITVLVEDYKSIKKSVKVLNDSHHQTEKEVLKLDTKISTIASLVKWLISPAMILALLIELARLGGVIA